MRIAMMGSGGVGGYFGGRMTAAGCDVTFIARGRHLEAIRKHGLRIDSRDMNDACIHPAKATDDPADVGVVDYVIVGVKLWETENAGRAILPMVGPQGCVPRFVEKERRPPLRHQGIRSGGNLRVFENLAQTLVAVDAS